MGAVERQFERYRASGSPRALGKVYDALAPALSATARRLAPDPLTADDLVQLTFLTAIERAPQFQKGAPLLPWLTGILARHAKAEARRDARRPDPLRIELRKVLGPDDAAQRDELDAAVEHALAKLPSEQRSVLVLRLRHGLGVREIADALDRPSGTVRSQMARGLERLRAALPSGLATGGALAVLLPGKPAAMRAALLSRASALAPSPLATGPRSYGRRT